MIKDSFIDGNPGNRTATPGGSLLSHRKQRVKHAATPATAVAYPFYEYREKRDIYIKQETPRLPVPEVAIGTFLKDFKAICGNRPATPPLFTPFHTQIPGVGESILPRNLQTTCPTLLLKVGRK